MPESAAAPAVAPAPETAPSEAQPNPNGAAAPESAAPAAEKPAPRTFKAKINGREVELPEEEVIQSGLTAAQIRRAATAQFEEAKKARAEVESFRARLQQDPVAALEEAMGGSGKFRELAEQYLVRQLQMEQMNPDQQRALRAEQEAAAYRKRLEDQQKSAAQREMEAQQAALREHYNKEFSAALANAGVPRTTETVRRMASLAKKSVELGLDLKTDQIATLVRQDMAEEQAKSLASLKGPALLAALGPALLKAIREADVASVKSTQQSPAQPRPQINGDARPGEVNPHLKTRAQWLKGMGMDPSEY